MKISQNGFQLTEQTRVHGRNCYVQCSKGNKFKIGKPELQFIFTAHRLMKISQTISELCNGHKIMKC